MKTVLTGLASLVMISVLVLVAEYVRRRLTRVDSESARFREAVSSLPGVKRRVLKG
jgi:hypothetical protein